MTEPATIVAGGYATAKGLGAGAAFLAAMLIAITRPPKNRAELFTRAFVAIASSLLFGGFFVTVLDYYIPFVNVSGVVFGEFHAAVHGLVGATAWGVVGGVGALMDFLKNKPVDFLIKLKSIFFLK